MYKISTTYFSLSPKYIASVFHIGRKSRVLADSFCLTPRLTERKIFVPPLVEETIVFKCLFSQLGQGARSPFYSFNCQTQDRLAESFAFCTSMHGGKKSIAYTTENTHCLGWNYVILLYLWSVQSGPS